MLERPAEKVSIALPAATPTLSRRVRPSGEGADDGRRGQASSSKGAHALSHPPALRRRAAQMSTPDN